MVLGGVLQLDRVKALQQAGRLPLGGIFVLGPVAPKQLLTVVQVHYQP
jgi:hypothetical protein